MSDVDVKTLKKRNTLREKLDKRKKKYDVEVEKAMLQTLCSRTLVLPIISTQLVDKLAKLLMKPPTADAVNYILRKLGNQGALRFKTVTIHNELGCEVISVQTEMLLDLYKEFVSEKDDLKRRVSMDDDEEAGCSIISKTLKLSGGAAGCDVSDDIMSLLSMPSTREKQNKQVGEEILELLTRPTAKERSVAEKFKSHGGAQVMEFCPHGTKVECLKAQQATAEMQAKKKRDNRLARKSRKNRKAGDETTKATVEVTEKQTLDAVTNDSTTTDTKTTSDSGTEDGEIVTEQLKDVEAESSQPSTELGDYDIDDDEDENMEDEEPDMSDHCTKLHFKKIIQSHTDESLGDCSFLNTCFHMATCKYVHYEVDTIPNINTNKPADVNTNLVRRSIDPSVTLYPPQWIQCDLRYLDMTVLGKFAVVMADPPWDIHMELPYGTMSDDEMRQLNVPALQDDGLIFLWVTGRAMELGRECLQLWGYERVDELIWVKTNQLQRIIRTGRTGHWLNHGKEHCLVGMKGNPKNLNRGLDCDVIVAEVRATSHKPDEIYGIIERLSPGTRKIELFGRPHNVQPNWITLGNQLDGIRLVDPELITQFQKRYPDGNCMSPGANVTTAATPAPGNAATPTAPAKK